MGRIESLLLNPLFFGLPISILVILLLPSIFDKYKTEEVGKKFSYESKVYYCDLNNDSFSEYICMFYSGNQSPGDNIYNTPAIVVNTDCSVEKLSNIIDQYNFTKKWFKNQKLYFGDFDNDGFKEVYFYTYSNDSLFLQGFDVFKRNGIFLDKFICKFNIFNNSPDILFSSTIINADLNSDGFNEIIGSIIGAYTAQPRFIYSYDINNDVLRKSRTLCMNLDIDNVLSDKHNNVFIATGNYAPGNVNDSILTLIDFTDYSSWLAIFDKNLEFVFPPVENKGLNSAVVSYLQKENNELFIYSFFTSQNGNGQNSLKKFNITGIEISSKDFIDPIEMGIVQKKENDENVLYFKKADGYSRIDINLNLRNPKKVEFHSLEFSDIDIDGNEEIFNWQNGENFAYIYTSDFSHPAKVDIKDLYWGFILSPCKFKDNSAHFAIHSGDFVYYFKYVKNPVYYLQIPFYFGIYFLISFLFYIVMYFQRKALQNRFDLEQKMTELELLTIKNQMDPHFTFNAINTASLVVYNEDKKTAYKFLVDFSNLIRNTLKNSKEISVPLKDELEFVRNYLHLQQFRHDFAFHYNIHVASRIDQNQEVPKMIIQTFAENAIKHGLVFKKEKGNLDINIQPKNISGGLKIEISDDGIGRKKAAELKKKQIISTGKGHDIINQIIFMYNKLKNTKVSYKIEDLYDGNKAAGTKIIISIPR